MQGGGGGLLFRRQGRWNWGPKVLVTGRKKQQHRATLEISGICCSEKKCNCGLGRLYLVSNGVWHREMANEAG